MTKSLFQICTWYVQIGPVEALVGTLVKQQLHKIVNI